MSESGQGSDVARPFEQAELEAERLVSLLRIAIALSLAAVFLVAVLGASPDPDPVLVRQWVFAGVTMASYFALGLASYLANVFNVYRPWMAWVAVTGDCLFLLLNAWFALANTGLDAAYLAALPSLWLTPVVLTFGALRFNPALQAYMIILIVAGFGALAALGEWSTMPPDSVASQTLAFFFAPPPNAMRLAMLALAGAILVLAAVRTRRLLEREIQETRRRTNLTRYLPRQFAERLADGDLEELRRGERRQAAVMFIDIRDFTARAQSMPAADLSAFMTEFRHRVAAAANANGGTIDKFVGDGALIIFGLTGRPNDAAADALVCSERLLADIDAWSTSLASEGRDAVRIGIGVHWGEIFCGVIGDETRLEFAVLGDTVNVASRLEQATKRVGWPVLASSETIRAAGRDGDAGRWQPLDDIEVRGHAAPLAVFGFGR